ncbi:ankyrin repeat domain-containing protein [Colletotrichum costaricense]|uniref:Ankyrin repeat domain-containing protein n=1 Tax=Colletotrichum costaricense TaxID=1209916 RepID=A0AAI9YJQ3_9PEZI|nr:ankyrin repeat domain-containing protein [Colletotrichum costaricense]KAK1513545.1 ankyrin repeat domain-containing protein [Colletotrichum costaricense]
MDPLSISAGIIAITTVAAQVANLLAGIREDWDSLPGRMHALSNEIQDFNVVLQQVAIAVKERRVSGQDAYGESTLLPLLVRGNNVLVDLKAILERLLATGTKKKEAISRVLMWRREQGTVSSLQEQIKQVKSSLNVLLGASNSQDMMHVRLCLEELSLKISHSKDSVYPEKEAQDDFIQALLNEHHGTMKESLNRSADFTMHRRRLRGDVSSEPSAQLRLRESKKSLRLSEFVYARIWALYGQQYETCKFLMSAGADPTYKPIAPSDDCPSDKAGDIILRANISQEVIEILRLIAEGSDFNERQNFARIHKIVLGLCIGDLEEEIRQDPKSLDFPDGTGRTALQWAAARGDERAVVTLLSWGADPNNMDKKLNTPLTLAANQNQSVCVRLLLEAGALPDPELPPSVKFGTPLNCAARNAPDPVLMKTLLDFNAKIEASGVDGVTPLLHVARGNSAAHAMLLLEYGADINATSKAGQTPLTAAIQYNNHSVLKLLLERWFDYNECPRLKGPNLLETVARYADVETILLLTAAEHLRSYPDKTYILDHYKEVIDGRNDSSDELSVAFDELLSVLKMEAKAHGSIDELMESGLLIPLDYGIESEEDSSSDLLVFEDAKEMLDISSNSSSPIRTSCPAHDLEKSLEEKTGGNW